MLHIQSRPHGSLHPVWVGSNLRTPAMNSEWNDQSGLWGQQYCLISEPHQDGIYPPPQKKGAQKKRERAQRQEAKNIRDRKWHKG